MKKIMPKLGFIYIDGVYKVLPDVKKENPFLSVVAPPPPPRTTHHRLLI
jgi:hypothetical protein